MKRLLAIALIVLLLAPALPTRVPATAADTPPLLALLATVPDRPENYADPATAPRFVDFQALYDVEGIADMRGMTFDALNKLVPLPGILMRIAYMPDGMSSFFINIGQMRDTVGFQWIADVNQSLEFGAPPQVGTVLSGTFDADAIGAALSARGFTQTTIDDVPVWSHLDDGAISIQDRDTSDPFGGQLGSAARVALLPDGMLANARFSAVTESIVHAALGDVPTLATNPAFAALANAITAPDGVLIQAWFLNGSDSGMIDTSRLSPDQPDPLAGYGTLAPYALAVIADRQEGSDQVHLIGLVYPDAASAQAAADEVAQRVRTFTLPGQDSSQPLIDRYGAQVSSRVYDSPTTGNAVALVEARYPLPTDRTDPDTGRFISGGLLYRAWATAILRRAFAPLAITGG